MHPILFHLPVWVIVLLAGGVGGAWLAESLKLKGWRVWALGAAGAGAALLVGALCGLLQKSLPVQGYGTLILAGFLAGVWLARRRAPRLGIDPRHCTDVGVWGCVGGLLGARLFHVALNWEHYSPFGPEGAGALLGVFALWKGGLVFFGAFVAALIVAAVYCRIHKLPILPFMDLVVPSLIAGQAFGRLGCLMRGCCFGKVCYAPWAISFPPESQVYQDQASLGQLRPDAAHSLPVYPTQIIAALGAALVAAILYAYWPRRRYDGQVLGLALVLAAVERFFEEFLRGDVPAGIPALSASLTIAQWFSLGLLVVGAAWLILFQRRGSLYAPRLAGEKT